MARGELTDKQEMFCREYMIDFNGSRAAIAAGYSKKTSKEVASENLTKPNIQKFLSKLKGKAKKDVENRFGITKETLVNDIQDVKLLFVEIRDMLMQEKLDHVRQERFNNIAKVLKVSDFTKSIEMLAKMLGLNEPDKVVVGVEKNIFKIGDQEIEF